LPKVVKRCKVEALSAKLKDEKIYAKLRKLRCDAKYKGQWEKKAKEAEAAKK
jgi:hypothetical protein